MKCHCLKCDPEGKGWGATRRALHIEPLHNGITFEEWVKLNYQGRIMPEPPENFDPSKGMFYNIDGKQYGPIKLEDIPEGFQ